MLVGRKNCRKIVQFLIEPLIKKQSISPRVSGFFVSRSFSIESNSKRPCGLFFAYPISLASD